MVRPRLINLDFADEACHELNGQGYDATGESEGEGRAAKAAEVALQIN